MTGTDSPTSTPHALLPAWGSCPGVGATEALPHMWSAPLRVLRIRLPSRGLHGSLVAIPNTRAHRVPMSWWMDCNMEYYAPWMFGFGSNGGDREVQRLGVGHHEASLSSFVPFPQSWPHPGLGVGSTAQWCHQGLSRFLRVAARGRVLKQGGIKLQYEDFFYHLCGFSVAPRIFFCAKTKRNKKVFHLPRFLLTAYERVASSMDFKMP